MSNKQKDQVVSLMADTIVYFQDLVSKLSKLLDQTPEEVIRNLVNSKWDIRDCLDYKDRVSVMEAESQK